MEATFVSGLEFQNRLKEYQWFQDVKMRNFLRADKIPVKQQTKKISTSDSDCWIHMWHTKDTLYWYSKAEEIYLNENCTKMFFHQTQLTDIRGLTDVKADRVKNMSSMFNSCIQLMDLTPLKN